MDKFITIATDGSAEPNPGHMAIGVLLFNSDNKLIKCHHEKIGWGTNNVAEYRAMIEGLSFALQLGYKNVRLHTDSELVYRQLSGAYKISSSNLKPLAEEFKRYSKRLKQVELSWNAREGDLQRLADAVSKGTIFNEGEDLNSLAAKVPIEPRRRFKLCQNQH